ncbi:MAG TPA: acetyl-CoA carboxylase biotin carboxyl carrier protein subunit [Deltaproteobacteria bacterium]|nr:acetyl-CoA carboxylase biotin carboxyl carrier protein subunit [Deltaproteobacteria bacterium]
MTTIVAPMPGTILEVLVAVGDDVVEDQELLILEAMKMENPICATCKGKIRELTVTEKDTVQTDQILVVME